MQKPKPLNALSALVYSTNKDVVIPTGIPAEPATIDKPKQKLRIRLETKQRGGKAATIIAGFVGTYQDMELLSKQLKNHCGCGGTAKDGEMLIQGDHREKIKKYLIELGYKDVK